MSRPRDDLTRRLDVELVARGLARSRGQARDLVTGGAVLVDGQVRTKAAATVHEGTRIELTREPDRWVSRAALKLRHALEAWGPGDGSRARARTTARPRTTRRLLDPRGRRCLDVGASTGGFTQTLLAAGAASVTALDVGHGQLVAELAADPRVTDLPGTNIRDVRPGDLGAPFDLVVADLSFISLELTLGPMRELTAQDGDLVVLVKPQFEVGRQRLGRDGIVTSPREHSRVLLEVHRLAKGLGLVVCGALPSPIRGTAGNREFVLWLTRRAGDAGLDEDDMLERMDLKADS
ncbi:MAG: TlyA family RNA methyltransferase [Intrasporangium sp.]|uniref:TlyA family RNA methyltransferase n=1 Tax=Intrasporangium sp. TaxID=1925024 RepID=UPI0026479D4A|nr:TlyA family RNA methyltransferase [Intrasporangium sp.]MDN5794192.1 TlyA family RNA methyltransferase [Intrasporangium sp.]